MPFLFWDVDSPDVLLWAVKPAEDDAAGALVVRSWNVAAAGRNVQLTLGDGTITAAQRTSHIETPGAALTPNGASLALSFAPGQWLTCRLEVTGAGDGLPVIALSKTTFRFGAERNGVPTQAGTSTVSNSGQGTLVWAAVPSDDWLSVSPASGTGHGRADDRHSPHRYGSRLLCGDRNGIRPLRRELSSNNSNQPPGPAGRGHGGPFWPL